MRNNIIIWFVYKIFGERVGDMVLGGIVMTLGVIATVAAISQSTSYWWFGLFLIALGSFFVIRQIFWPTDKSGRARKQQQQAAPYQPQQQPYAQGYHQPQYGQSQQPQYPQQMPPQQYGQPQYPGYPPQQGQPAAPYGQPQYPGYPPQQPYGQPQQPQYPGYPPQQGQQYNPYQR